MKSGTVAVRGLDEFRRELKKLAGGATDMLKDANYKVASLVVTGAQSRADTPMRRVAMSTLRASRSASRAQVTGGSGIEFFGGAEFGAGRNKPRNTRRGTVRGWNQFSPWRGSGSGAGYALYPFIRSATDEIVDIYGDEMEKISRAAFPD